MATEVLNAMKKKQIRKGNNLSIPELWQHEPNFTALRLTKTDRLGMPPKTEDISELRRRLGQLFHERFQEQYGQLEVKCDIKRDTFQKMMRYKNGRNITYTMLAKFCIGAGLTESEANELFLLTDHHLNKQNQCDYILLCTLKNGDDISDYDSDMQEYGYGSVLSKAD